MKGVLASEEQSPGLSLSFQVEQTLAHETTPYQSIYFGRSAHHGVFFMLDGAVMLTEKDEHVYHEMIVHNSLLRHRDPKNVLVVGGGDLGTARECLRHPGVELVQVVEIDERVVDLSREHLPWAEPVYGHDRCQVFVGDGFAFLAEESNRAKYDVIIIDSTDAVGDTAQEQASRLFSQEFFQLVKQALAPGGLVASQFESAFYHQDFIAERVRMLRGRFGHVRPFVGAVPMYPGGFWCFYLACDEFDPRDRFEEDRYAALAGSAPELKYFSDEIAAASFALPASLARKLA